jgi:ATP-dependent helicase Lhr and Lhr-like helicase
MTPAIIEKWFADQGWQPFDFQRKVWRAMQEGQWGLLHASTGSGKTMATWLGALTWCAQQNLAPGRYLKVLWITPMRALAGDTAQTLSSNAAELATSWAIEMRTSDTSTSVRARQNKQLPDVLVTTPESLSVLLSGADAQKHMQRVQVIIIDEWHELLASKRGVQVQLALARLVRWQPSLVCWGMSATLGNIKQARETLCWPCSGSSIEITDDQPKQLQMQVMLPRVVERFPWAGHMGLTLIDQVIEHIHQAQSTLIFVNTRAQSERWYQALLDHDPALAGSIALHHGSLDINVRQWVEAGLKGGELKAVVCTSSLDLGVDFSPVQQVLQIGSAKGVARLMQRAGRAGHAPGQTARVTLVPTHSLEILEALAACDAVQSKELEARASPDAPMDVLVQHLVTVALGGGFTPEDLYTEVRQAYAYRDLSPSQWQWALDFVSGGGQALAAYPDYRRAFPDEQGIWRVTNRQLARRHRMSIGTIVSDAMMQVRFWKRGGSGGKLGQLEESFIARIKPGDCFYFAGRLLELVRVQDMTAFVRRNAGKGRVIPRFMGGNMPLSTQLADAMLKRLDTYCESSTSRTERAQSGQGANSEDDENDTTVQALEPILQIQRHWSALPSSRYLLVEHWSSREGTHLYIYPFAGRHVNQGLASLICWRLAQTQPLSFTIAVNDYGFELLCAQELDVVCALTPQLFDTTMLQQDLLASLNAGELSQRRFREIARVAGLVFQGYPGAKKTTRQVQASSSLFYEVFNQYDPANALLAQAKSEALQHELQEKRLCATLLRLKEIPLVIKKLQRPTPFAFPLLVERLRERLSTEQLSERVARMVRELERAIQDTADV